MDLQLFLLIYQLPHNAFFDGLAQLFSGVGKAGIIWFVLGVLLFLREEKKNHRFFIPIVGAGLLSGILVGIVKSIIARPRPTDILTDFSFPSGHATIAFAMAVVLSKIEPKGKWWLYGLALAISFTRIYLGVHYPLDVLAGGILGWSIGKIVVQWRSLWE